MSAATRAAWDADMARLDAALAAHVVAEGLDTHEDGSELCWSDCDRDKAGRISWCLCCVCIEESGKEASA